MFSHPIPEETVESTLTRFDTDDRHTLGEVSSQLKSVQGCLENNIGHWRRKVGDETAEINIVYEDPFILILEDETQGLFPIIFEALEWDRDFIKEFARASHAKMAQDKTEGDWSNSDALVFEKGPGWRSAEDYFVRRLAERIQEHGSVAEAVDTHIVETYNHTEGSWAEATDREVTEIQKES